MLSMMLDLAGSSEVRERATKITALFHEQGVPGDGHTFMALVLLMVGADKLSTCSLGPTRLGNLVSTMRVQVDESSAKLDAARAMKTPAERATLRPRNYAELSEEAKWQIDKALGILDWDGK